MMGCVFVVESRYVIKGDAETRMSLRLSPCGMLRYACTSLMFSASR